jgi:hypothetical protein
MVNWCWMVNWCQMEHHLWVVNWMVMYQWRWVGKVVDVGSMRVDANRMVGCVVARVAVVAVHLVVLLVDGLVGAMVRHPMADVVCRRGDGHVVAAHGGEGCGVGDVGRRPGQGREEREVGGGGEVMGRRQHAHMVQP